VVVAYAIGILGRQEGVGEDTAIGVLFSGAFALGIVLLSWARAGTRDLASILLGNVLGVSNADLVLTATVALLAIAIVALFLKELVLVSFDPALARSLGRSVALWDGVLLLLLALALAVAFQTAGNLLVLSLLLAPAATAQLLTRRLLPMMALAVTIAIICGVVGLYLSYWQGVPSGPTIVLLCGALFILALLFARAIPRGTLPPSIIKRQQR
jgi:ABC-type Mn2+/Zn2+ transport system permease subunit